MWFNECVIIFIMPFPSTNDLYTKREHAAARWRL